MGPAGENVYKCWQTRGATESSIYQINPLLLNHKANGTYAVIPQVIDIIKIEAFIPQEYVMAPYPGSLSFPLNGNYKKTPMDASFDSGSAIFVQDKEGDKLKFKLYETVSVVTFPGDNTASVNSGVDSVIVLEQSSDNVKQGETRSYKTSDIVNGHLPPDTVPQQVKTGIPRTITPDIHHLGQGKVQVTLHSSGYDPLIVGAPAAPITWRLTVSIDRSGPNPKYIITGTHQQFPAYGIWINGQSVYHYDPIQYGHTPPDLFFSQDVNEQGNLNQ